MERIIFFCYTENTTLSWYVMKTLSKKIAYTLATYQETIYYKMDENIEERKTHWRTFHCSGNEKVDFTFKQLK